MIALVGSPDSLKGVSDVLPKASNFHFYCGCAKYPPPKRSRDTLSGALLLIMIATDVMLGYLVGQLFADPAPG
jgi:hypothetical protein